MKKTKILAIALSASLVVSAPCLASCGKKGGDAWRDQGIWLKEDPLVPKAEAVLPESDGDRSRERVAVHDPSVFRDPADGQYYAFGTHFAVASSYDLVVWAQLASDNEFQKLYGDESCTVNGVAWPKAIEETVNLVKPVSSGSNAIRTTWAPDVEYLNGKYYMYYSITGGFGSSNSAIARVEADNVMGPYTNNQILLQSVDSSKEHFVSEAEGGKPNCIDSELFFDKDGKLWMVYGSHFGGVYIKELYNSGENIGLPKDEGAGKLLWKGAGSSRVGAVVEGPFVFYNATTKYYYLMTSYGALMTDYNMRVARSANPDGPYTDVSGKDMAQITEDEAGRKYGNVIAGNFRFDRFGNGQSAGYAAMGHNSVIKDEDGNYFVVYHTRRQADNGSVETGHSLCSAKLFFNKDGWPVMSPTLYVGEEAGTVAEENVAGEYDVVLHSEITTVNAVVSQAYKLTADGKVMKGTAEAGTWSVEEDYYITLTLGEVEYKGVVSVGWDNYAKDSSQKGVYTISATSPTGASLWALSK